MTPRTNWTRKQELKRGGLRRALIANAFAAFKGNESKKLMETPGIKERIGSVGNQFAIMTIIALLTSIPLALFKEGPRIGEFVTALQTKPAVYQNVILSGLTFYG